MWPEASWGECAQCEEWAFVREPPVLSESETVAELRRKLKKANKENEDLRQTIRFQRTALTSLGEQFVRLGTLLKEQDV